MAELPHPFENDKDEAAQALGRPNQVSEAPTKDAQEVDEAWLHGSIDDARAFQDRGFPPELMARDSMPEPWLRCAAATG
jgi:hypothetical protein